MRARLLVLRVLESVSSPTLVLNHAAPAADEITVQPFDAPGIQLPVRNFSDGHLNGNVGKTYKNRFRFFMEPPSFVDSLHEPGFWLAVLKSGEICHPLLVPRFGTAR